MPRIPGKNKEKISFTCDNSNFKNLNGSVESGEFSSMSEGINKAISFFYANKDSKNQKMEFKEWIVSEEGEKYLKGIIRSIDQE